MPTLIYLIGFMGSGKSTLGRILANVLGYDFLDLDEELERRFGCSIQAYFAENGEDAFRKAEQTLVEETTLMEQAVVSAGGGAFLYEANRSLMQLHGLTVYLRLPVSLLMSRLGSSRDRPLLFGSEGRSLKGEALRRRIVELLEERKPYYEQAQLIIDIEADSIGPTVDYVATEIQAFWKRLA